MPAYTQANQPLEVTTALGKDALLITGFRGEEGISRPFRFHVEMVADVKKTIPFDQVLGKPVSVRLSVTDKKPRYFHGICQRFKQGESDEDFCTYHLEMVPQFWLLTKVAQSRIFQRKSVPEILKQILKVLGPNVSFQLQGTYQARNYCVQYRETDFNFASRLMEDEGIYYFFTHAADGHQMVVADSIPSHPDLPLGSQLIFEKKLTDQWREDRVLTFGKQQELLTGTFTLWDHSFQIPDRNLQAKNTIRDSVRVGRATHDLKSGQADTREHYDYPAHYAVRYDGVDPGGGDQPLEIQRVFKEKERVVAIRQEQEGVNGVVLLCSSTCRQLVSGHRFKLQKHAHADGDYLLTSIQHSVESVLDYRSAANGAFRYANTFTAIPLAVPFRPQRLTPKPTVQGSQTATVVGPANEEIYTDKYGRVKVQFHWDRQGTRDARSSCWIRVSTTWADKGFGFIQIPRIGQEVIVDFLEGDPDWPIITGCVYNAKNMPPFPLPEKKMISGAKSNSYPGGGGNNQISMDDTKGKERMFLNAQFNQDTVVGNNRTAKVAVDSAEQVGNNVTEDVGNDKTVNVANNETTTIGNNQTIVVGNNILIQAGTSITLQCGASTIHMNQAGIITITGTLVTMAASINANVAAPITNISGAAMLTNTGALNVSAGLWTHHSGAVLGHFGGGKAELTASGECLVKGATVKLN